MWDKNRIIEIFGSAYLGGWSSSVFEHVSFSTGCFIGWIYG